MDAKIHEKYFVHPIGRACIGEMLARWDLRKAIQNSERVLKEYGMRRVSKGKQ